MIAKLKKTALGQLLYRVSRTQVGTPLRYMADMLKNNQNQRAHSLPQHKKHNQRQMDILAAFERNPHTGIEHTRAKHIEAKQ